MARMCRILHACVVVLLAGVTLAQQPAAPAPPDARDIIRRAAQNAMANQKKSRDYTFIQRVEAIRVPEQRVPSDVQSITTTLCHLVQTPASFNGKMVELQAEVFVTVEGAVLIDRSCPTKGEIHEAIWLEVSDDPSAGGAFIILRKDASYNRFWKLINTRAKPRKDTASRYKYTVTATMIGRFDHIELSSGRRFGPGNMDSRLVLESVRDVVARPFDPPWRPTKQPTGAPVKW